jgi:DNA invertase Pin-like site-specific DNA recombinase
VSRLDRLARSSLDLLNTLEVVKNKAAKFKSLGDAWADTTTPHGRLILNVLSGIAEFERELIMIRTTEGRIRAKAAGKKFGRKPKLTTFQEMEIVRRRADGETVKDLARSYGVSHPSILRALERREANA